MKDKIKKCLVFIVYKLSECLLGNKSVSSDKLTQREKWLMQQAWNQSKICDHELKTMGSWLNEEAEFYYATIENLLASEGD